MTSKMEAAAITNQLALRWNAQRGCYEVHTTVHGSNMFRWYAISDRDAEWYASRFELALPKKTAAAPAAVQAPSTE